jgi:hypothetical protein
VSAGGQLYGFTLGQTIVKINPANGASMQVATSPVAWYGAGAR